MCQFLIIMHSDETFDITATDRDDDTPVVVGSDIFVFGEEGGLEQAFIEVFHYCKEHKIVEMKIKVIERCTVGDYNVL